jgi:predicted nucleotidyltransferase
MSPQIEIENKLLAIKPLLEEKFHVDKIGYFGSYARNEHSKESDIDILVSFKKTLGWEFFDLQELLENELQLKVDLVSEKGLKEQLRDIILKSVKYI